LGAEWDEHDGDDGVEGSWTGQEFNADDRPRDHARDRPEEELAGEGATGLTLSPVAVQGSGSGVTAGSSASRLGWKCRER
jgi:hypothetical protein